MAGPLSGADMLAWVSPAAEICPHMDARAREVVTSAFRHNAPQISIWLLQPWIRVIARLLWESQIPRHLVAPIIETYIPQRYRGAAELDTPQPARAPAAATGAVFHRFSSLPAELRLKIWALAAEGPARVIYWGEEPWCLPVNGAMHMPRVAQACPEAWRAVRGAGAYWGAPYGPDPDVRYWAARRDVVFIPGQDSFKRHPADWDVGFLRGRRTVAVAYDHFVRRAPADGAAYAWLRGGGARGGGSQAALETLVLVTATPRIRVHNAAAAGGRRWPERDDIWGGDARAFKTLVALVTYDERGRLAELDRLWRDVEPSSAGVWKEVGGPSLKRASIYGNHYVARCLECELRRWRDDGAARARTAWLRLQADDDVRADRDVFPDENRHNGSHPWVREVIRRMPRLQAAVLLQISTNTE